MLHPICLTSLSDKFLGKRHVSIFISVTFARPVATSDRRHCGGSTCKASLSRPLLSNCDAYRCLSILFLPCCFPLSPSLSLPSLLSFKHLLSTHRIALAHACHFSSLLTDQSHYFKEQNLVSPHAACHRRMNQALKPHTVSCRTSSRVGSSQMSMYIG